jgi:penicillin-binding protein 1A
MRPIFKALMVVSLISTAVVGLVVRQVSASLPDDRQIVDFHPPVGQPFVSIKTIPPVVVKAFLAAEDGNFYNHPGIDLPLAVRAMGLDILRYASGRRPIGASTITQQLVKNLLLDDEVTFDRKIKEALLALRIERALPKDRILEIYLNEIYLGCGSRGLAEAASNYFGKSATTLSIEEAAFLAGLPKAPNHYDPSRYPGAAANRRNWVLDRMVEDGYLDAAQAAPLKGVPVRLAGDHCRSDRGSRRNNSTLSVVRVPGERG